MLFTSGCSNKEFKKGLKAFQDAIEKRDISNIKENSTVNGIHKMESIFGDFSQKKNQNKFFNEINELFANPYVEPHSTDSVIYVLSNKPTGIKSANTLTFKKFQQKWLLDDYRRGK